MHLNLAGAVLLVGFDRGWRDLLVVGMVSEGRMEIVVPAEDRQVVTAASISVAISLLDRQCVEPVVRKAPRETLDSDPWRRRGKRRGRQAR